MNTVGVAVDGDSLTDLTLYMAEKIGKDNVDTLLRKSTSDKYNDKILFAVEFSNNEVDYNKGDKIQLDGLVTKRNVDGKDFFNFRMLNSELLEAAALPSANDDEVIVES